MWDHRREPHFFRSGGPGSGLWSSVDGGDSWERIEEGLPAGELGRIGLAFSRSNPDVVYALVEGTPDFEALSDDLGPAMTAHGAVMLFAGIGFGVAVARAGALPAWTGWTLAIGVVLVVVSQGSPEGVQLIAAGVRDLGIGAMGIALLRRGGLGAGSGTG